MTKMVSLCFSCPILISIISTTWFLYALWAMYKGTSIEHDNLNSLNSCQFLKKEVGVSQTKRLSCGGMSLLYASLPSGFVLPQYHHPAVCHAPQGRQPVNPWWAQGPWTINFEPWTNHHPRLPRLRLIAIRPFIILSEGKFRSIFPSFLCLFRNKC